MVWLELKLCSWLFIEVENLNATAMIRNAPGFRESVLSRILSDDSSSFDLHRRRSLLDHTGFRSGLRARYKPGEPPRRASSPRCNRLWTGMRWQAQ